MLSVLLLSILVLLLASGTAAWMVLYMRSLLHDPEAAWRQAVLAPARRPLTVAEIDAILARCPAAPLITPLQ